MNLPSKKIIPLAIACLIALGVIIFGFTYKGDLTKKVASQKEATAPSVIIEKMQAVDTDSDNLPDWEEVLWKADPRNPDTDGDGTKDGDEIAAGRDPVKKGPKDNLADTTSQLATNDSSGLNDKASKTLTATEQLSQRLLSQYVDYKSIGALQTKEGRDALSKNLATQAISDIKINPKIYNKSSLNIVQSWTKSDVVAYGNTMATIMDNTSTKSTEGELRIFQDSVEKQDPNNLKKLDPIIKGYEGLVAGLSTMTVPAPLADTHLDFVNTVSAVLEDVRGLRVIFSDPIYAYVAISAYVNTDAPKIRTDLKKMERFFIDQNISYDPTDPGYKLLTQMQKLQATPQ